MARPQTAICAEGAQFGIFLTLTLEDGPTAAAVVRRAAAALPGLTAAALPGRAAGGPLSAIGFGATAWPRLFGGGRAPADLFVHIHSPYHDANFAVARALMSRLEDGARLVEEIHGFRTQGGRDLTGFVDGTENPQDEDRARVALVGAADPAFAGGSYAHIQRYIHDLRRWESLDVAAQEAAVGRTKADDIELDDEVKPPTAHIARVVIEQDGAELEILRHSLPYGTTTEHGLYFLAYGGSPAPFRRMLDRMVRRDGEGHADRLLDFTRPVTGAAFFMPSLDFLEALA